MSEQTKESGENVSLIQALTARAQDLSRATDSWNTAYMVLVFLTVVLAAGVFITQRGVIKKSKELASIQSQLIADAGAKAAEANEKAESERLARIKLEAQVAPRRLTGEQKTELTKFLKQYPDPVGIVVVSAFLDSESSDFADDFDAAITDAKWKTLRLKDRLTQKTGVSLGVYEGTPRLDPWGRPILKLEQRVGDALKAIGVPYNDVTFGKDDLHSTGTQFEPGPVYLVVERKPPTRIPTQ